MGAKITAEEIIFSKTAFPRMLKKNEGEVLKKYFDLDENFHGNSEGKGNIEKRYSKIINGDKYSLLEEYLFKENETVLEIGKAIGINYYLSKRFA